MRQRSNEVVLRSRSDPEMVLFPLAPSKYNILGTGRLVPFTGAPESLAMDVSQMFRVSLNFISKSGR